MSFPKKELIVLYKNWPQKNMTFFLFLKIYIQRRTFYNRYWFGFIIHSCGLPHILLVLTFTIQFLCAVTIQRSDNYL